MTKNPRRQLKTALDMIETLVVALEAAESSDFGTSHAAWTVMNDIRSTLHLAPVTPTASPVAGDFTDTSVYPFAEEPYDPEGEEE